MIDWKLRAESAEAPVAAMRKALEQALNELRTSHPANAAFTLEQALSTAPAAPDYRALADRLAKAAHGMMRLSEMGFEQSMKEPEENGNYSVYCRMKEALAEARTAGLLPVRKE